ncbi:MAG: Crp/Fnr family transcriptional regulator [Eubacterium sp.]|nr:Crp/Fnr family transcriptional regulator [Eubacterium sp.]
MEEAETEVLSLKKNESISLPEQLKHLYLVLSGKFVVIQDSGMNASLAHLLGPGKCFGVAFCAEGHSCNHSLRATEKSEVLRISFEGFLAVRSTREKALRNLLGITSENLRLMAEKVNHTQSRSVRTKISLYLRDQMEFKGADSFVVDLSRKDAADYLNITYPAMLRELSSMQKEGVIQIDGNRITVLNRDALIEGGADYSIL